MTSSMVWAGSGGTKPSISWQQRANDWVQALHSDARIRWYGRRFWTSRAAAVLAMAECTAAGTCGSAVTRSPAA